MKISLDVKPEKEKEMNLEKEMEKGSWLVDPDKDGVYEEDFTYGATSVEHATKVAKAYAEERRKELADAILEELREQNYTGSFFGVMIEATLKATEDK